MVSEIMWSLFLEHLFRSLALHIHGVEKIKVPIFDIEAKAITKGPKQTNAELKHYEVDFGGRFSKFSVMEELGLDPRDLCNLDILRPKLRDMLISDRFEREFIHGLNDKQLFDKLIESRIESKCAQ